MIRKEFHVGQEVGLYKSRWKGLLDNWECIKSCPFTLSEFFAGGTIELIDPGDTRTFIVKGDKLKSYGVS